MNFSVEGTDKKQMLIIALSLLLSATISTLFCSCASPLYRIEGTGDPCCFLRAGAAWANGMRPYVDFIDVKGPLLFLLHKWAWQLSPGSALGMWGIETFALFLTLVFLFNAALCVLPHKQALSCISAALTLPLTLLPALYGSGARVEMYTGCTLAFLLWQTCLFYGKARESRHAAKYGAAIGVSLGCCLLLKYNACAPAFAALACACIEMLLCRAPMKAALLTGSCILTALATCIPFIAYMITTGTLENCLGVYFALNTETLQNSTLQLSTDHCIHLFFKAMQSTAALAGLATLPFLLMHPWTCSGHSKPAALFLIGGAAFAASFVGNYSYYMLFCAPLAIFPAVFICSHFHDTLKPLILVCACVLLSLLACRINNSWDARCHLKFTQKLTPAQQAMEKEVASRPNGTIMFLGTLDCGTGLSARLLPACPEWFTLNGAPDDFVQRQLRAIKEQRTDYVFLGSLNLSCTEALQHHLENSGYERVPFPVGKKGEMLGLYRRRQVPPENHHSDGEF